MRECGVYCELLPHDAPLEKVAELNPKGFILSGGPTSVYDEDAPVAPSYVFESELPVLGICYGMQLLAHQLGGSVAPSGQREYGHAARDRREPAPLFADLPSTLPVWMSHGDHVTELPPGFRSLARSGNSPYAVIADGRDHYGIQFHPEVVHTPQGAEILRNFLFNVCRCQGGWTAHSILERRRGRARAGRRRPRDLRPLRRRRLGRGGGDHARGDRRPADLRLRRQRRHAPGRAAAGAGDLPPRTWASSSTSSTPASASSASSPA